MVYDLSNEIIYYPREFGIFGLESMRVVEGIYVHNFMVNSGMSDPTKAFLIKIGRLPNKQELKYQDKLSDGIKAPHGVYKYNWSIYSAQNVFLQHPILVPSTDEVSRISEDTFGHKLKDSTLHEIGRLIRNRMYSLQLYYYGVNVWQVMGIASSLDSIKSNRNEQSISLLFNKIYKRDPINVEIKICKNLKLTNNPQEIQDEIEQYVKIHDKNSVGSRRGAR